LLMVVAPFGTEGSSARLTSVPIDVDILFEKPSIAEPSPTLREAKATRAASSTTAGAPSFEAKLREDALQTRLQALAKLRQPENTKSIPSPVTAGGGGASGRPGRGLEDLIRAQVERRWNLDLVGLGDADVSVPIRVEITKSGVILKAEIVGGIGSGDRIYDEVAVSARNAVLMSSPIQLPPGHYQPVMDMVLTLNPRDAIR
jgi:hypothetical protein